MPAGIVIAAEHIGLDRAAREQPAGRIQPQRFIDDLLRVGQGFHLLEARGDDVGRGVDFGVQPRFHFGVLRNQIPGPVEPARGGLMAGDHQRHDLIDELALAHRLAGLLVARAHEHADEVEVLFAVGAAPLR